MNLREALELEENYTLTENFAKTYKSTTSHLLDLFAMGGSLRTRSEQEIINMYTKANTEDTLLALKCLFYIRDIRGGQGERRTFRTVVKYLGDAYPKLILHNIKHIPFYGRWDDLYALEGTRSEEAMFEFMNNQLLLDLSSENPTLLAKWLKSENTSSAESRRLARKTRKAFGMTHKQYRKTLSALRAQINIVERKMCANKWDEINYEHVPSRASMIYSKAFRKHDKERYEQYLSDVSSGKKEIKTETLYPYDIIRMVDKQPKRLKELTVMWDNQKDWTEGEENSIVVCDTSGSMFWAGAQPTPIYISTSLAMYFAERNKGPFHNSFITFSHRPHMQKIVGSNIFEKFNNLSRADWEANTNLEAVFDLILNTARRYDVPQEEMVDKIYIISDMEFDSCITYGLSRIKSVTNFQRIKQKYKKYGYDLPQVVFWNVQSRQDNVPVKLDERGVMLVSGSSPSTFKNLMKTSSGNPVEFMLEVLNDPRYDRITLPA